MVNDVSVWCGAGAALGLIALGTAWLSEFLASRDLVLGVRTTTLALAVPILGVPGWAVAEALWFHHSLRIMSAGFSWASVAAVLVISILSLALGIKSINAGIFRYLLLSVPLPLLTVLTLADSVVSHFESIELIVIYGAFLASAWRLDRRAAQQVGPERRDVAGAVLSCAWIVAGAAALVMCARSEIRSGHKDAGEVLAGFGIAAQLSALLWIGTAKGRWDLAVAGILGNLAFNSTAVLGVVGFLTHRRNIDPSAYMIEALLTLAVPAALIPLAFAQTKRVRVMNGANAPYVHLNNIFTWRDLKRDLSNFQLLRHRNVNGTLVSGMNSGTHWVTVMLATAIAEQYGLPRPKYFSLDSAGEIVSSPRKLVRHPGVPAIARSHNLPAALLSWRWLRRIVRLPPQVVLVRDIREVLISAYVKWIPDGEISFSEFVRGDPANRRPYLCDAWWYVSFLNRWGDVKAAAPDETLVVRYEDVVADPERWLRRIADHFGIALSEAAVAAALALRDKKEAQAKRDPRDNQRIIADPAAKATVRFSEADLQALRNILAHHLRYDYGYDYGIDAEALRPIDELDRCANNDNAFVKRASIGEVA